MVGSSDTFSSALSYALERMGMTNLALKEEQLKSLVPVYQGKSVFLWLLTGFGKSILLPSFPIRDKGQRGSTLYYF